MNIVLFLPLGFLLPLAFRSLRLAAWTGLAISCAVAFVLSASVEIAQLLFLPDRYPSLLDVLANTLGGFFGYAIYKAADAVWLKRKVKRSNLT